MVEGSGLENRRRFTPTGVRIPHPPPLFPSPNRCLLKAPFCDEMRPCASIIFFGLFVLSLLPACEQSLEAQFNDDRKKYAYLIPTLPPPSAQLPVIGAPSDIGTESELLMVWRTQAFYWGYALESMGAELVMREGDIPLLVDLDAARIIWGPYRDSLMDEWCVISPLDDFNPDWSLGGSGQPFERSYGRLGADQLELLVEGELWLQLGTTGTETIRGLAFWDREQMLAQACH